VAGSPRVDLLVLFYNSRGSLPAFFEGIRRISIPITAYFLDNDSRDGTADLLAEAAPKLPFPAFVLRSSRNNGFARGVNLLARQSRAEFMFLLNPDTELEAGCLETLVQRMESEPRAAICEARQSPREHTKAWDPATGETTWCSGAAALVRRKAFDEVGGFDERLYFMYCEDVDLSWKFWMKGWKCLYAPEAVVRHFTQDLTPGKRRTLENYFSFRNSLFLYYRFGTRADRSMLGAYIAKRFFSGAYSVRSKALFAIALIEHIRYIPYLINGRGSWGNPHHHWVRLKETSLAH
jgi:GT2 family glycosyltransferase